MNGSRQPDQIMKPMAYTIGQLLKPGEYYTKDVGEGSHGQVTEYIGTNIIVKHHKDWSGLTTSFVREVSVLTALRGYPSIVQIRGFDPLKGDIFMDKLANDLEHWIEKSSTYLVTDEWSAKIQQFMGQIETGLMSIHRNGFWHRDIKPANILMYDDDHTICISDFGLTVATPNQYVPHTNPAYTMTYGAPEMLENAHDKFYDGIKCDIFSFGITFLELVTMGKCKTLIGKNESEQLQLFKAYLKNKHTIRALIRPWCRDESIIDLLSRLLHLDPSQRIDHSAIVQHVYFKGYTFPHGIASNHDWWYQSKSLRRRDASSGQLRESAPPSAILRRSSPQPSPVQGT